MSEMDRGTSESKMHNEHKLLKIVSATFIAIIVFASSLSLLSILSNEITPALVPAEISYTIHSPISINDDSGFTNISGVVWGNGTVSDPYIISGWEIDASSAVGIDIENTNAYFIVKNCYVYDGGLNYIGIFLSSCKNGTVRDNMISNNFDGIHVSSSSDNIFSNNNCSNNGAGMNFDSSSGHNTLSNNTCSNNNHGICLGGSSSDNSLSDNTCDSNLWAGIYLESSSDGNTLSGNNCSWNNNWGMVIDSSSNHNTLRNNNCSSNGKIGIIVSFSSDNTLSDNICNLNSQFGIKLVASDGNYLINNTCDLNAQNGIRLWSSNDNNICWNQICNNSLQGAFIESGSDNRIWNNTFINNNGAGDIYDADHIQALDNGTFNWWYYPGSPHGYGNNWSDWRAPDDNGDGIVDIPYDISGSSSAKDNYPLTIPGTPIPEPAILILAGIMMMIFLMIGRTRKKS